MGATGRKFSYYRSLGPAQKRIYDKSDAVSGIRLPGAERFFPSVAALARALETENHQHTETAAQKLITALCDVFRVPRVVVRVLAKRPSRTWGEMHGLYEATEGKPAVLTVWMRTAKRVQVVAFRTFLRTIIHEFMHHLDYAWLKLGDSFHTEGFYKRESQFVRLLLGEHDAMAGEQLINRIAPDDTHQSP